MEPLTVAILSAGFTIVYDRYKESKATRAALAADSKNTPPAVGASPQTARGELEPVVFPAEVIARFTAPTPSGALAFNSDRLGKIRKALVTKSVQAVSLDVGALGRIPGWQVVPRRPGLLPATVLIDQALASGGILLGSLSLFLVVDPKTVRPIVLVVGGPELLQLAGPGGHFALIQRQAPAIAAAMAPPAPAPAPTPSATPAAPKTDPLVQMVLAATPAVVTPPPAAEPTPAPKVEKTETIAPVSLGSVMLPKRDVKKASNGSATHADADEILDAPKAAPAGDA